MYERYRDRVQFVTVYIKEAHPLDEWQLDANETQQVCYAQPKPSPIAWRSRAISSAASITLSRSSSTGWTTRPNVCTPHGPSASTSSTRAARSSTREAGALRLPPRGSGGLAGEQVPVLNRYSSRRSSPCSGEQVSSRPSGWSTSSCSGRRPDALRSAPGPHSALRLLAAALAAAGPPVRRRGRDARVRLLPSGGPGAYAADLVRRVASGRIGRAAAHPLRRAARPRELGSQS